MLIYKHNNTLIYWLNIIYVRDNLKFTQFIIIISLRKNKNFKI